MVKRPRHWEIRFESVVRRHPSKYGTIAGSNPVLTTNRGIGVPLEAKYKSWSLNVNQPLNQLNSQVAELVDAKCGVANRTSIAPHRAGGTYEQVRIPS